MRESPLDRSSIWLARRSVTRHVTLGVAIVGLSCQIHFGSAQAAAPGLQLAESSIIEIAPPKSEPKGPAKLTAGVVETAPSNRDLAILALRDKLAGLDRVSKKAEWIETQNRLADLLLESGEHAIGSSALYGAVHAYQETLTASDDPKAERRRVSLQIRLGLARARLGARLAHPLELTAGIELLTAVLARLDPSVAPLDAAEARHALGWAEWHLGARELERTRRTAAIADLRAALAIAPKDLPTAIRAQWVEDLAVALREDALHSGEIAPDEEAVKLMRQLLADPAIASEGRRASAELQLGLALGSVASSPKPVQSPAVARREEASGYAEAETHLDIALEQIDREAEPRLYAEGLEALGHVLRLDAHLRGDPERMRAAAEALYEAFTLYSEGRAELDAARVQSRLGIVTWRLARMENSTARFASAIDYLKSAAAVRTREFMPKDWAQTQINLSMAMCNLARRDRAAAMPLLDQARQNMQDVLLVLKVEHDRDLWAYAQSVLGLAASTKAQMLPGSNSLIDQAIVAYRASSTVWTETVRPVNWISAQIELGSLLELSERRGGGKARLDEAIAVYEGLIRVSQKWDDPGNLGLFNMELGSVLQHLGEMENSAPILHRAADAALAAVNTLAPLKGSEDNLASARFNLGIAYLTLGERFGEIDSLKLATRVFRLSAEVQSRDRSSRQWPKTMSVLGLALLELGKRTDDLTSLQDAVAAFKASLSRLAGPNEVLLRAKVQVQLGDTLREIAVRTKDAAWRDDALTAYQTAVNDRAFRQMIPQEWTAAEIKVGDLLRLIAEQDAAPARLSEALAAYRLAEAARPRKAVPLLWAETEVVIAEVLVAIAGGKSDAGELDQAVIAYQGALAELTETTAPERYPAIKAALERTLALVRERRAPM